MGKARATYRDRLQGFENDRKAFRRAFTDFLHYTGHFMPFGQNGGGGEIIQENLPTHSGVRANWFPVYAHDLLYFVHTTAATFRGFKLPVRGTPQVEVYAAAFVNTNPGVAYAQQEQI